jgi:aminoglycoside phosphotransferase (APT) family kinase protein
LSSSDTSPVRAGEELDVKALGAYLRSRLGADVAAAAEVELSQFAGGHSNLTYLIKFGAEQFVLRRPPVGPVAPTAHDMPREFRLLEAINPYFSLAPRPVLLCEDVSVIGVPFYLMERRDGLIVRDRIPGEIGDDPAKRRSVSEAVIDTLASLHQVDIQSSGIVRIGKPEGFVRRQVRGWSERWQRSRTSDISEMDEVRRWLGENVPVEQPAEATIVQSDFKLDNIMLAANEPSRVVAVLDWEMCSVGDPLIDLGLLLCYWTLTGSGDSQSLRAVTVGPGWMTREEMIARYQERTGRDLSRIVFYETFARFKVAVIIQQIYFRFVRGQTSDQRFRNFDRLVQHLATEAYSRIGER